MESTWTSHYFFLEINYKHAEMEIVDMLPLTIALKKIKHLGIKLVKEVKKFYNERQTSGKEMITTLEYGRYIPCLWVGRVNIVQMNILRKAI